MYRAGGKWQRRTRPYASRDRSHLTAVAIALHRRRQAVAVSMSCVHVLGLRLSRLLSCPCARETDFVQVRETSGTDLVSIHETQHACLRGLGGVGPVQVRGRARRGRTGHSWGSIERPGNVPGVVTSSACFSGIWASMQCML